MCGVARFRALLSGILVPRCEFRPQHFEQPVGERRRFKDGGQQQQAAARIVVLGCRQQSAAQLRIAAKALRPGDQPQIKLVLVRARMQRARLGEQLGVVALRVIDQVAGMHLEKSRQQQSACVGQVRARAALDLREVRLAHRGAHLCADGADQLLLGHRAVESAKGAFDFAKVADFLAKFHIAIRNNNIANCDMFK